MPPDLNSLPPSSASPMSHSPPPASHTPPHSLAAAAAMNAGIQNEESRRPSFGSMRRDVERARRRSSIRMNLNLNDPTIPAPGELQQSPSRPPWPRSPHHERAPSLGELHQELEYEQEGQVNRLLTMIRQQQAQIVALQTNTQPTSAIDDNDTPTSERSLSLPHTQPTHIQTNIAQPLPNPVPIQPRSRSPFNPNHGNLSRHSSIADRSRESSHTGSPALRPISRGLSGSIAGFGPHESNEWLPSLATRDEITFYQAETQMVTRENQMLKLRIRELERQLLERDSVSWITHSPATPSSLVTSPSISRSQTLSREHNTETPNSGT